MPAAARRLRLHARISGWSGLSGRADPADLRRCARNHEDDHRAEDRGTAMPRITTRFTDTFGVERSEAPTSASQPPMRITYVFFCLQKKNIIQEQPVNHVIP